MFDPLADEGVKLLDKLALRRRERGDFGALIVLVDTETLGSADQRVESSIELDREWLALLVEPSAARTLLGGSGVACRRTCAVKNLGAAAAAHTAKLQCGCDAASERRSPHTVLTLTKRRRPGDLQVVLEERRRGGLGYP
jgi:hypothetical protein